MTEAQTTTTTIREGAINPLTRHMYTNDDVAMFRALQPDRPDPPSCYVTVGTFARRGLSSTAKTLRSLSGVRGSEY